MNSFLNFLTLFMGFMMVMGCIRESSPPHLPSETEKVHASIHEFFNAVESSEWSAVRKNVTDDFLLIEGGHRMNFKDLRQMIEAAGYTELTLQPENFQTHIEGNRAYTVYDNYVHYQTEEGDGPK